MFVKQVKTILEKNPEVTLEQAIEIEAARIGKSKGFAYENVIIDKLDKVKIPGFKVSKEAGGNKSVHSIEMLCRMITFTPSKARSGNQSRSAVHCVIAPLLERLRLPDIDAKTIRKRKKSRCRKEKEGGGHAKA